MRRPPLKSPARRSPEVMARQYRLSGSFATLCQWLPGPGPPSRPQSLLFRWGQPIEEFDYDGLALGGEAIEVLPIGVSAEGVH
jgi:hypothetical protein